MSDKSTTEDDESTDRVESESIDPGSVDTVIDEPENDENSDIEPENDENSGGVTAEAADGDDVQPTRRSGWIGAILAAGLVWLGMIALFTMETSAPDYDPLFMRVLVERTAAYGGSYYSNGIHNKGPLEPFLYSMALHIGGADGFWFVIAVIILLAAIAVASAGAAVVATDRGGRDTTVSVMVVIVALLTVSGADYAGVLYSRNMSVALLSFCFAVGTFDRFWSTSRRRVFSVLLTGAAIGLAVQTLITAAFTGGAVLVWLMWRRRNQRVGALMAWVVLPLVAALVFFSAPAYYRIFGPWDDFVDGFWTHARYMSAGTGRSLTNQFGLGWTSLKAYYKERPEQVVVLLAWLTLTVARWKRDDAATRGMRLLFAAWWLGAWVELVLSQRYSSHYFSVVAVPTILMATDVVTVAVNRIATRVTLSSGARLLPLGLALIIMVGGTSQGLNQGVEAAAVVRSPADFTYRREVNFPPRTRTTRAALDLISHDGDPLLMWTNYPWPYLDLHRVSATRFIWRSFMIGEIYLGSTSEEFVLPSTWENFAEDIAESQPLAYLVETVTPLDETTPFADYVNANFTIVYTDDEESLSFRNDVVDELLAHPVGGREMTIGSGASTAMCSRFDGTLAPVGNTTIDIVGSDGAALGQIALAQQTSSTDVDVQRFEGPTSELSVPTGGAARFSLIAGDRAVVLFIEDRIVGAISVPQDAAIVWRDAALAGPTTVSNAPPVTGCGE